MGIRDVLAADLRLYRRAHGFSQEKLADHAGVDRTYISALERCVYAASIDVLERLAVSLAVAPDRLLKPPEE